MGLIEGLNQQYQSIAIVGLAKNAGKTVTLNYLIEEAYEHNILLGLTSTGRDGERLDLVTDTEKPTIFVVEGTLIATARSLIETGDAGLEILEVTEFTSPLGHITLCRVKEEGTVQLAGPTNSKDAIKIRDKLLAYGAELVLLDGAIDRKAVSAPGVTDACVVSTGAVLSRDIRKVVWQTSYFITILTLPKVTDSRMLEMGKELTSSSVIDDQYQIITPDVKTSLGKVNQLMAVVNEKTKYVYLSGAVTTAMMKALMMGKHKPTLLIDNGTQIFSDYFNFNSLVKKGLKIEVLQPIEVKGITVNPVAPVGYSFDSETFVEKIKEAVGDIPVIDVLGGIER
jgi:hypothetical protein